MPVGNPADKDSSLLFKLKSDGVTKFEFTVPEGSVHNQPFEFPLELTDAEADREIDLSTYVNALECFYVAVKSTGAKVLVGIERTGAGAPPVIADSAIMIGNSGMLFSYWNAGEAPPKLHLSNPNATDQVAVVIGGLGSITNT